MLKLLNRIYNKIIHTVITDISVLKYFFYKMKNSKKEKIFFFSDSRGWDINDRLHRKDPFHFYLNSIIKKYNVDYFLCPEKHTTIIDFLRYYESSKKDYDYVILHAGVVDFSPRPVSNATEIYKKKRNDFDKFFSEEEMKNHFSKCFNILYEGEKTINIYPIDLACERIIPELLKINNLIWINCNHFVKGWEGNYFKKRPENINIVETYSSEFSSLMPLKVDLSKWTDDEVKKYTVDNIHFSRTGADLIVQLIENQIENVRNK